MAVRKDTVKDDARARLERVRDLASYALTAEQMNRSDDREWYRTLLRAIGDMRDECIAMERTLSEKADAGKILTPSEIAEAAKISRAALYKRRASSGS